MKKHIVVLGIGFAGFRFLKKINLNIYDVTVISPRNHFLFNPLLPSTTVGTIEFRSIIEPIRNLKGITFIQGYCREINQRENKVICEDLNSQKKFDIDFDYLIIAVGEVTNIYGLEDVNKYALFLKELSDARKIRTGVINCFENASVPGITEEEKKRLLRFIVCGGGATGVEFAAELHDFIEEDVKKKYKYIASDVEIILIETGNEILASFDKKLREYTTKIFKRDNIIVKFNSFVKSISEKSIHLNDGTAIDYGLLVWATGNTSAKLIKDSNFILDKRGKLPVDNYFRVGKRGITGTDEYYDNIFALGDCSHFVSGELPVTAQVAQKEGLFLAICFNKKFKNTKPFTFKNLGMLAYIGSHKALADLPQYKGTGFTTFVFWRSAYLTKLVSLKNKILVLFDWVKTFIFGRDVSNF
jgi:NADH:ubiquinone reductase (non-electrogenic)